MEWNVGRISTVSGKKGESRRNWGQSRQQPGGFREALARAAAASGTQAGDSFTASYRQKGADAAHTLGHYVMTVNERLSSWALSL